MTTIRSDKAIAKSERISKRAYAAPSLVTFGTLREMTLTVAANNTHDGAGNNGSSSKTS